MKIVWVNRSFLDYRIPVYYELDKIVQGNLTLIFSGQHTPDRVQKKIRSVLRDRAVVLEGEKSIFNRGDDSSDFANSTTEISFQSGLFRAIRRSKPDVLIGEGFFKWTLAALKYRLLYHVPLVISYERTHHTERNCQLYRTLYRKLVIRFTHAICCNGTLSADYLNWLGMPRDRIVTGGMAADSEELTKQCESISIEERCQMKSLLNLQSPVFLFVGQLIPRKGMREFLEGWKSARFDKENNQGSFLIVGDGPERKVLEDFVREQGLDNVRFTGSVDYDEIARYYSVSDVFVMPTLEDNWSLVVPEAMACGLPILCSIYNGCWPELVHEGENGFTFDPLRREDIVGKILYMFENQHLYTKLGEASRRIQAEFSPAHAAQAFQRACLIALNQVGSARQ